MVHKIAFILLVIGGLNWLLTAFGMNVVNMALSSMPMLEKALYILVGLSAVYEIFTHKSHCTACSTSTPAGV